MVKKNSLLFSAFFLSLCSLILVLDRMPAKNKVFARDDITSDASIQVIPLQIDRDTYGLAMVDTLNQTVWVYGVDGRGGGNNIRLLAARNWKYDRLLEQYNTADPKPEQIKEFLQKMGVSTENGSELSEEDFLEIVEPAN